MSESREQPTSPWSALGADTSASALNQQPTPVSRDNRSDYRLIFTSAFLRKSLIRA